MIHRLEFYDPSEIAQIVTRSASILGSKIDKQAADTLSTRARLTPRIAYRFLKRLRDYADINGDGIIDMTQTEKALKLLEVDAIGLDPADRLLLTTIIDLHDGGPVGLNTLAAILGDEATTIEDFIEPYLLQIGLLERTPRGRKVTSKAYKHLGKTDKRKQSELL